MNMLYSEIVKKREKICWYLRGGCFTEKFLGL